MSRTAFLISCSDHYHHRMYLWDRCLQAKGYTTRYITSNFDHTTKQPFTCSVVGSVQIPVRPYRKNLSFDRILSHRQFAKAVKEYLDEHQPKVVVALLPPNFLAHYLSGYKKAHPDTILIFDIFDLWPETFPSGRVKKLLAPVFSVWAGLRDRNLSAADHITTECDLFRQKLALSDDTASTIHLCAPAVTVTSQPQLPEDRLSLCYLGAINNVIGITEISGLLKQISAQRPVTLHIIGSGERQQEFIDSARLTGAEVIFHGPVYDPADKMQILDRCHFGLNIMKGSVCVGLTMKSVDYFRFGLPIINNIPADTGRLIGDFDSGIPLDDNCAQALISVTNERCLKMRANAGKLFFAHFTENVAQEKLNGILDQIID